MLTAAIGCGGNWTAFVTPYVPRVYSAGSGGSGALLPQQANLNEKLTSFAALVKEWKSERGPTSSVSRMAQIPSYQKIIAIGEAAIPLLLAELEREPDHWFIALHAITGADPVPKESRGRLKEMVAAWLRWGKEHGINW